MFFYPFQSFLTFFLSVILITTIVPSYKTIIGMAMHVWVNISVVGDTTPAKMKARRMKKRRLAFSIATVTSPRRDRTKRIKGSSNPKAKGRRKAIKNDKYADKENIGCRDTVAKPMKNWTAAGRTQKKAKAEPL